MIGLVVLMAAGNARLAKDQELRHDALVGIVREHDAAVAENVRALVALTIEQGRIEGWLAGHYGFDPATGVLTGRVEVVRAAAERK